MKAVVVAFDLLTPFGRGVDVCWRGLLAGQTTLAPIRRFDTSAFVSSIAGLVDSIDPARPESLVAQMLLPLLHPAAPLIPRDARLILATTAGEIDFLEKAVLHGNTDPRHSRPNVLLAKTQEACGLTDPGMVISAACVSSTAALAHGASLIQNGAADCVLVVAADAVSEFVFSGFSALLALDPEPAKPFDARRQGLSLGEAAGYALLMSDKRAAAESRTVLGEIAGYGLTNDANHMTGPSRDGRGLAAAVEKALASAGIDKDAIGSISAHGTGTPYNDSMEMKAFRLAFGGKPRPTYSVKGAIGHTLGAAGLVETVIALKSLHEQIVPPTANLQQVDPEAAGWASASPVPTKNVAFTLSSNSGFGGVNAALVLGMPARTDGPTAIRRSGEATSTPVALLGVGWINPQSWGSMAQRREVARKRPDDEPWKDNRVFASAVKNFARFDPESKLTCFAGALALQDAGIEYAPGRKQDIGLLNTNSDGCLASNLAYFEDYVKSGRASSRGNLFIYTLPSSPIAEAAVHFGFQGPLLYATTPQQPLRRLLDMAEAMIRHGETSAILLFKADRRSAVCLVIGSPHAAKNKVCELRQLSDTISATEDVSELVRILRNLP